MTAQLIMEEQQLQRKDQGSQVYMQKGWKGRNYLRELFHVLQKNKVMKKRESTSKIDTPQAGLTMIPIATQLK